MSDFSAPFRSAPINRSRLIPLDAVTEAHLCGGARQRAQVLPHRAARNGEAPGRAVKISGAFYQINIAFNFIMGGSNNTITNIQGNGIDSLSFKVLGLS
ncbi:hypothetical protein [Vulcanococcus sp.]|jgi:hypothetical protein|uniref:hypothetical protein n=1 Tax=Vulcanococcus sp. TaxID=2856995 RepID=UPI0037D9D8E0